MAVSDNTSDKVTDAKVITAEAAGTSGKLAALSRAQIIKKFGTAETDTGSPEVQIALLTHTIERVAGHVKKFEMDRHSQRGMMAMISRRKKLLSYLKNMNVDRYRKAIGALGLRK